LLESIRRIAQKTPKEECCGLIAESNKSLELIECNNESNIPAYEFIIDPQFFIENKVKYVYHSHVDSPPFPSKADKLYSDELCVPFLIYSLTEDSFFLYENVSV
tara:strand:+ start:359 stop:670 length:312 start_codon:yes stop_codon:yes gene_type:complete